MSGCHSTNETTFGRMRSSEDSADDEFVFVTNREVTVQTCGAGSTPRGTGRPYRSQPRLNQPIPTTLDLDLPSDMHSACAAHPTGTTITTTTTARAKATPLPPELIELLPPHLRENTIPDFSSSSSMSGAARLPRRPPPPPSTFQGDYYNLDAFRSNASPHSFEHLAELVSSSDAFSSASDDASSSQGHTRTSSLPLQRPCPPPPVSTNASLTAPAALALTDSGISSGGSSSISSRSSSSKSLPREGPRTLNNRPVQSPSPRSIVGPQRGTATHGVVGIASHASGVASAVVAAGNEGRGRLRTRTPSPSPVLTPARAVNGYHEATHTQPTVYRAHYHTNEGDRWRQPHLNGINSTAHGSAFVPTTSHKLIHTPALDAGVHLARDDSHNRVVVSAGSGVAFYNAHRKASPSPTRAPPICCTPPAEPLCRHARPSPPPSPEMRRAWNVIGVPVSSGHHSGRNSPARSMSPTSSGRLTNHGLGVSRSDPNAIYDNIRVFQPSPSLTQHPHAPAPCRATHSPAMGKPPSPPQQRRASRSPSPVQGWVVSRPGSPHCAPCHHAPHGQHGGCWIPVWGSSPQLYPDAGSHYCPSYVYSTPPCAGMCGARSHSCDRIPSQPSPPPSPVCGRRSPSPWRGGSAPPVNHRHSPSPDRTSGRPPRPRRPAHRKAKTVEVGQIGSASPIPAPTCRAPSPLGPTPLYMPASAILSASQSHLGSTQAAGGHVDRRHHGSCSREASPLYQNLRGDYEDVTQAGHGGVWPAAPTAAAPPHPRSPSGADRPELKNDSKPKVTYKTTFYKCMKNLLKPTQ